VSISTIAQLLSAATNLLFVVIIAVGYFLMIKLYKRMVAVYDGMLKVTEAQRTALGRPQVIVDDDYSRLSEVDIVIRNMSEGAAKEITFEFSAPVESSDGTVVYELSYFKDGLDFLAPGGHVTCYWDHLPSLLPLLEEKGLEGGISVTTRYKDLAGQTYETTWNLKPAIYRDGRYVQNKGIQEVARAVEEISSDLKTFLPRHQERAGDGDVQHQPERQDAGPSPSADSR
jgi:hypothetical protein